MPARDDVLAAHFLKAAGVAAVAIKPDLSVSALDVAPTNRALGTIILCCRRGQERQVLDMAARINEPSPAAIAARLRKVAAGLRITLTAHDVLIERARAHVADINMKIEALQHNGDLSLFNQQFTEARQQDPRLRYADFLHAKKLGMVEAVAANLS